MVLIRSLLWGLTTYQSSTLLRLAAFSSSSTSTTHTKAGTTPTGPSRWRPSWRSPTSIPRWSTWATSTTTTTAAAAGRGAAAATSYDRSRNCSEVREESGNFVKTSEARPDWLLPSGDVGDHGIWRSTKAFFTTRLISLMLLKWSCNLDQSFSVN